MKICFITDNIFSLGGVQRVVSVLTNELCKNYEIDILCVSDNHKINREIYNLDNRIDVKINTDLFKKNIITKVIGKMGRILNDNYGVFNSNNTIDILTNIYFPKGIRKKFIKYLNNKNYDLIIGVEGIFSILLGIISKELNAKTIGWQHNSYEAYFKTKKKYYWNQDQLFKRYLKNLDNYIVLTDYDKKLMNNNFDINCNRIYNPLSFESNEKSECVNKNMLFVGRLVEQQKGIDLLIKAFKIVTEQNDDWTLTIVGDGPDKQKIIDLIKESNLEDRIILRPFTDNVQKYYIEASLFISSSRWEGFGLVITEAMECGLPVISFDNSGPREIINNNGVNGILIPSKDPNLLGYEILDLINNKDILSKIARNSITRAKEFNRNSIAKEWDEMVIKKLKKIKKINCRSI